MRRIVVAAGFLSVIGVGSHPAWAVPLVTYEFQGQPGTQTTVAPASVAANIVGAAFGELNLTPVSGANSINASGWSTAGAAYTFGFTVASGYVAAIDELILTSRASGTGPGFLSVQASVNGGSYATVASLTQSGTAYNDEMLAISPLSGITSSVSFRIVAANQVSASGGTVGSSGTFRIGDYNASGTPTPFTIDGTIRAVTTTSVAEPSALPILAVGLVGLIGIRRSLT